MVFLMQKVMYHATAEEGTELCSGMDEEGRVTKIRIGIHTIKGIHIFRKSVAFLVFLWRKHLAQEFMR